MDFPKSVGVNEVLNEVLNEAPNDVLRVTYIISIHYGFNVGKKCSPKKYFPIGHIQDLLEAEFGISDI